jgi:hypothetical protein
MGRNDPDVLGDQLGRLRIRSGQSWSAPHSDRYSTLASVWSGPHDKQIIDTTNCTCLKANRAGRCVVAKLCDGFVREQGREEHSAVLVLENGSTATRGVR